LLKVEKHDTELNPERKKESNKMVTKFFRICKRLKTYLQNTDSSYVDEIKWILQHFLSCDTIKNRDCNRFLTSDAIEQEQSIAKLMGYVTSFSSFFNFKLVEEVIDSIGFQEGQAMMKEYKRAFTVYIKSRVIECRSSGLSGNGDHDVRFSVQLDSTFKDCRMEHLLTLRDDICEILKIDPNLVTLEGVELGSIWVIFHLPKKIVPDIFPITDEKIRLFGNLQYQNSKILIIKCEGYRVEIWRNYDKSKDHCICCIILEILH